MKPRTKEFKQAVVAAIGNKQVQANLDGLYRGFHQARDQAAEETPGWESMRDRARDVKAHTLDNLDYYLEMTERNVVAAGGNVFFATDAESATRYVIELARSRGVRIVIKGKSMLSEEMGLNQRLEEEGIESVETDLGEYIIQLADETPFHIIAPAIHKSRQEVSNLFQEKHKTSPHDDIAELTAEARVHLRDKFTRADMGITGANFVVAETGTVVLVTNEGNGRMCTSMPRIHVAIMGMERVVPSIEDMGLFLRLLVRSATGQRLSSYVTTVTGPRAEGAEDGPDEFHMVVVDNGRSRLLASLELREALYCIRCGACLNACPVYRKVGGHAYGWVYPGPIGAIVSPMLTSLSDARDLPHASTLCGNCREVCPVRIDMPRMLLHLRKEIATGETYPGDRSAPLSERLAIKLWRMSVSSPFAMGVANRLARLALLPLRSGGSVARLPGSLGGWTRYRDLPAIASRPFRARWRKP
jgi:L-lactate dehydrogenase complex protein LldF